MVDKLNKLMDIASIQSSNGSSRCEVPKLDDEYTPINAQILYKIHQRQLQNAENNEHNNLGIAHILGGIDKILDHYLIETTLLSQEQLQQIYHLITTPKHIQIQLEKDSNVTKIHNYRSTDTMSTETENGDTKPQQNISQLSYTFYIKNTIFHQYFNSTISQYLSTIFSNDILWILAMIFYGIRLIGFTQNIHDMLLLLIIQYLFGICSFLWLFGTILNMNKKAILLTMRSFTFWLKCYFSFQFGIGYIIYFYFIDSKYIAHSKENVYWFIADIISIIVCILTFAVIGLFPDCLFYPSKTTKIICTLITALCISWISIDYTFIHDFNTSAPSIFINVFAIFSFEIDCVSMMTNSSKTMMIFMWRMVLMMIFNKNKCIMIRYRPYQIWTDKPQSMSTETKKQMTMVILSAETLSEMNIETTKYNLKPKLKDDTIYVDYACIGPQEKKPNMMSDTDIGSVSTSSESLL